MRQTMSALPDVREVESRIGRFIGVLNSSLERATEPEDCWFYQERISDAVRWIGLAHKGWAPLTLKRRILQGERDEGWTDLNGPAGDAAGQAFADLLRFIRSWSI